MNDILQDLSTSNLVTAIEENLFSLMSAFNKCPQAKVHDEAEIKWSITYGSFPMPFCRINS